MMLAEKFGRTLEELLHGSDAHAPLSANEFKLWVAYESMKKDYRDVALNKAKSRKSIR